MLKFILFCILLCFIGAGYAAYQYAGVMGVLGFLGLILLGLIALPIIFKLVLQKYLVGPLKEGLKTMFTHLEGAELEVHSVHKTIQPDYYTPEYEDDYYDEDDFDDEDEEEFSHEPFTPPELDWYEVELTITPAPPKDGEPEETWEVGMLQIVSPQNLQLADQFKKLKDESREDINEDDDEEDSSEWSRDIGRFWLYRDGDFKEVLIWDDAEEPDEEYYELTGPQRVKLEISVPQGAPRAKLITNFRDLIEFDLPVEEASRIIYQD